MPLPPRWPLVLASVLVAGPAQGLDTWETFGAGEISLEAAVQASAIPDDDTGTLDGWFYGYFGTGPITAYAVVGGYGVFDGSDEGIYAGGGLYGTLGGDHVSLDLGFEFTASGPEAWATPTPWVELNLDLVPEQGRFGGWTRLQLPVSIELVEEPAIDLSMLYTVGLYGTLADGHQLLGGYRGGTSVREVAPSPGSVVLGYNAVLADFMELASEFFVGLPDDETAASVGGTLTLMFWFSI